MRQDTFLAICDFDDPRTLIEMAVWEFCMRQDTLAPIMRELPDAAADTAVLPSVSGSRTL